MSKPSHIPEELIELKAYQIWQKRQLDGRGGTPQNAFLFQANLQYAYLWHANLQEVNLRDANLQGAVLGGSIFKMLSYMRLIFKTFT